MSVIAAFPLKTGNLMFVGFDSQNTSHSFLHYPDWNLWVLAIHIIGFREWSDGLFGGVYICKEVGSGFA